MRVLLGLAVLASLFWMASTWQARQTDRLRRERDQHHGALAPAGGERTVEKDGLVVSRSNWSTLILGRPSGRAPIAQLGFTPRFESPAEAGSSERSGAASATGGDGWLAGTDSDGWLDGRSSGPIEAAAQTPPDAGSTVPSPATAFTYRVRRGDVLSVICADYYGTERGPFGNLTKLTAAVARHNGLASADALKAGETIELPAIAALPID